MPVRPSKVGTMSNKLRNAVREGKLEAFHCCWSPADTVADTRYQVCTNGGEPQILFHSEIRGFLAGLDRSE